MGRGEGSKERRRKRVRVKGKGFMGWLTWMREGSSAVVKLLDYPVRPLVQDQHRALG